MKTFKEKVAVITGAGSGMGRYLAVLLAKEGADVSVCDVNEETLNETVEMLRKYNVSVSSLIKLLFIISNSGTENFITKNAKI